MTSETAIIGITTEAMTAALQAKNADVTRGFKQLAVELVAPDRTFEPGASGESAETRRG